ncbi:exonuclease 1-like [Saccostrea echinata]|uniref:exonuclease 1-like n=1 Tax=Saccostrea echinata TaxID=191078 RepID=UPI002A8326E8|nr:exonuclease 1-like [Saccostrea echinata]
MGVTGLLPFLKKIHVPVNIAKFEGCTVAIDAYCWLHKGAFSCAEKLALGEPTDQYVYYCMKYVEMLLKKNIKPVLVFDGCHLPSKQEVEKTRREKRDINRKKAAQLLREGKRAEARECLQRCIDISPDMALQLMNACRARGVDCIVAPYEADAQLAYLNKCGIAQVIITEDSDLLLFGCEKVLFKMDHFGNGVLIEQSRLNEVMEIQIGFYTFEKFRYMCILSGCDYLSSLPGIGLGKAAKVFKRARQSDLKLLLKKFPSTYLNMSLTVPEEYIEGFIRANNTFLYQLVYDPIQRRLRPLNSYEEGLNAKQMHYAGALIPQDLAYQIALGNINIYTKEKFADFDPDTYVPSKASKKKPEQLHRLSVWDKNYRIRPKIELREVQNIERPNLLGKEVIVKDTFHRKRPSPEDDKNVKSDKELANMYLEENEENSPSPPFHKKRRRTSSDSEEELPKSPVKKFRKLYMSPNKVQFFDSLKDADQDACEISPSKAQISERKVPSSPQQCPKPSPIRNRFAVNSEKKEKFNINASKDIVKSRFFAPPVEIPKPETCTESKVDEGNERSDDWTEQERNEKEGMSNNSNSLASEPDETEKNRKIKQSPSTAKPSPGSVFTWSKFKFSKINNIASTKSNKVNSSYKKVVSEPCLSNYFSSKSMENNSEVLSNKRLQHVESCEDMGSIQDSLSQASSVSYSQESGAYSIDLDCFPDSQEVQIISEEYEAQKSKESEFSSQARERIVTLETKEKSSIGSVKSRCRASGLSKNRKGTITADNKQQSIKDLFSKFAFNKREEKLIREVEDKDVDLVSFTPSNKPCSKAVQRKLLP